MEEDKKERRKRIESESRDKSIERKGKFQP